MSITMTKAAAEHICYELKKRGSGVGIRLGVRTSGCSGMAYVLEFVDKTNCDDLVFTMHNASLFIDPKSIVYLKGTELDYVKKELSEGFLFKNPNVKDECGCGESFHV